MALIDTSSMEISNTFSTVELIGEKVLTGMELTKAARI